MLSLEHDRLVPVHEDSVLDVQPYGTRQDDLLEIASLSDEVVNRLSVRYACDVLLDDGTLVELRRRVMGRCSD